MCNHNATKHASSSSSEQSPDHAWASVHFYVCELAGSGNARDTYVLLLALSLELGCCNAQVSRKCIQTLTNLARVDRIKCKRSLQTTLASRMTVTTSFVGKLCLHRSVMSLVGCSFRSGCNDMLNSPYSYYIVSHLVPNPNRLH